jgi:hypothetical protein
MLTDPEARKDPAKMRELMDRLGKGSRQTVLDSVRTNAVIMSFAGWILLAVSSLAGVAFLAGLAPKSVALITCPMLVVIGVAFVLLARMTSLPPRSLLRNGISATATVREVKSIGRTIGIEKPGITATLSKVTVALSVQPQGAPAFDTEHSEYIVGGDLRYLQVGATVPVRCDRKNPTRLAFDWESVG